MHGRLYYTIILSVILPLWFAVAQQSPPTGGPMSDRDKAGLRGPVKSALVEQSFADADARRFMSTTTEYAPDGRVLEERIVNSDGSQWVTRSTYYPDGRLLKSASGQMGSAPNSETTYSYDAERRLVEVKSGDGSQFHYQYDDKGRKSVIESYDAKPLPPNTAYATYWEGTDLGFAPYPGGTLTTSYNEQEVATGAQLRDAKGNLVAHIARKFDAKGRIIAEEQFADNAELMIPEELKANLSPEQAKSLGAFLAGGMQNAAISYQYDDNGRVTERHRTGEIFEEVIVTTYNDRGDKASERTTRAMNPEVGREYSLTEAGAMIPEAQPQPAPQPPSTYEIQYTYQYDSYGNWTEQNSVARSAPDAPWKPNSIVRRKLTYYQRNSD